MYLIVLTHYCAGGKHMHSARITLVDADHINSVWSSAKEGKGTGEAAFDLARKK